MEKARRNKWTSTLKGDKVSVPLEPGMIFNDVKEFYTKLASEKESILDDITDAIMNSYNSAMKRNENSDTVFFYNDEIIEDIIDSVNEYCNNIYETSVYPRYVLVDGKSTKIDAIELTGNFIGQYCGIVSRMTKAQCKRDSIFTIKEDLLTKLATIKWVHVDPDNLIKTGLPIDWYNNGNVIVSVDRFLGILYYLDGGPSSILNTIGDNRFDAEFRTTRFYNLMSKLEKFLKDSLGGSHSVFDFRYLEKELYATGFTGGTTELTGNATIIISAN